ncbi:hypothetical protein ACIP17_29835 [Streptomyces iakyrus]
MTQIFSSSLAEMLMLPASPFDEQVNVVLPMGRTLNFKKAPPSGA